MNLVSEDKLRSMLAATECAQKARDPQYVNDTTPAGLYLRFYILLTEASELFAAEGYSAEEIFHSRYYWFCRYGKVIQGIAGVDNGLEQQGFKILEDPYPKCIPDWSIVERIQALAEHDAIAELQE